MPPALAEVHERQRRIIQTIVWFSLSLIVSVFVKDIGYAVALIGGLAALFIFFFPGRLSEIKPRANGHNIVGCYMLCPFAHVVVCCWEETGQTFKPLLTPHISIHCCTLHMVYKVSGCILPMVHCRSQHCLVTFVGHKRKIEPKDPPSC